MSAKKIITVFGATGAQGGGLAHAILNDKESEFSVRAVTRDLASEKAKKLSELGAELIEADIDDIESVRKAMEGAYGAYCVTFFWAHYSAEKEQKEIKNFAEAAKATGLKHVIWSTLEDTRILVPLSDDRMPTLQEKYKVPHFDGKGSSDHFFEDAGVPVTYLITSFYWDNLIYFGMGPKRGEDGKLSITYPMGDKKLVAIAAEDIGKCAYGIFKEGTSLLGKRIGIAGDAITCEEMAATLTTVLGEKVTYNEVTPEMYRGFGFPGADDLGNMFQYYQEFEKEFLEARNINYAKKLNPELQDFKMWVENNKDRLRME
ncbi:MAG: NmrA/HSCARG family protein [Ginsengibacter sp.]